jgi:hypothetical protein
MVPTAATLFDEFEQVGLQKRHSASCRTEGKDAAEFQ